MDQILKRKKKGRPPKSDRKNTERDVRRSLRRRNVKYVFDLDDYFDEEDELFVDDRREKQLDILLNSTSRRVVEHAPASDSYSSGDDKLSKKKKKKRRKLDDVDYDEDEVEVEVRDRKEVTNGGYRDSIPGTPYEGVEDVALPDRKMVELILDKLQKKDVYGVYAEPVDPEELPDYHEVIKRPMDFATVRNKLRNGLYVALGQLESDVFLICSNAMQYNSPDTVYHKQARSIQELAKRKFDKLKLKAAYSEKEAKSEQKIITSSSIPKKQIKRTFSRTVQEPAASEFSSGATLANPIDNQNASNGFVSAGYEKTGNIEEPVEANSVFNDNHVDKGEETLPGKGPPSRLGRKSFTCDENRRSTYSISLALPMANSESIFSTFDEESKQIIPVGLYSDHSYARSLARFAASLGSVAWRVASNRIEQALPEGLKFGRGWVGEYEPLPTPVLILENCIVKEPAFLSRPLSAFNPGNVQNNPLVSNISKGTPVSGPFLQKNVPFLDPAENRPLSAPIYTASHPVIRRNVSEVKPAFFSSPNLIYQQQNLQYGASIETDKKIMKQVELNRPPSFNRSAVNPIFHSQTSKSSEFEPSRSSDFTSRNLNFSPSVSFKHPDSNGNSGREMTSLKATIDDRSNSKIAVTSSHDSAKNAVNYYPHEQGQGLSDPVQLMRMLSEKAQNQQKSSNSSFPDSPQSFSSGPSYSNNAAVAAARVWMSVGAGGGGFRPPMENMNMHRNQIFADSLYNSSRFGGNSPVSGMQVQNGVPVHAFVTQGSSTPTAMKVGSETHFQNQQMVFPQMVTTDLSRFQMQPPNWQNLSTQFLHQRQKPESLPPDLNIGFHQSPSSSALVDSQQPDLALQL